MDIVKINTKTFVYGHDILDYEYINEMNGELVIKLNNRMCYLIEEGDFLLFSRTVYVDNNGSVSFSDYSRVKYEDENHLIHATLPNSIKTYLSENFFKIQVYEDNLYYIISCRDGHYLFGQDLETANQEVYFKSYDGTLLGSYKGILPLNKFRINYGLSAQNSSELTSEFVKSDCIVYTDYEYTCGKTYDKIETRHYHFAPESESMNSFILTDFEEFDAANASYIETKFNPFYYYEEVNILGNVKTEQELPQTANEYDGYYIDGNLWVYNYGTWSIRNDELDSYNKPIKHCHFYGDIWFDSLHDTITVKYVNDGTNLNKFYIDRSYYSVNIGLTNDSNESNLGCEDFFSELFAKKIEQSLIPEFIDMERVKYVPCEKIDDEYFPITSITIYNHFRERVYIDPENNTNTLSTSGNVYYDGWYIDTDNNYNVYWNGYEGGTISDFIENNKMKSDLIGFLNFTDNDIYYKKNKVSKSFFRLSFYDSNDPIEQKLLYYSTVFLDSTELFCKFLKQNAFIEESNEDEIVINKVGEGNENVKTVFCENEDIGCRLDTTLKITNEYDKQRCSEGFNIYLFSDDAQDENSEKTIYMKVEFNHAGNGKTIPMIVMPTDVSLTMDNFMEYLYIPITIKKYNGKYIYIIDKAIYDGSGNLKLCLFEPKLEL